MNITLDRDNEQYLIDTPYETHALPFAQAFEEAVKMADILGKPHLRPSEDERGTEVVVQKHQRLLAEFYCADGLMGFHYATPLEVQLALVDAADENRLIRVFYGDMATGRDRLETDLKQTVGRFRISESSGAPLLCSDEGGIGVPIETQNIVKILDVDTGQMLHVHPQYHHGMLSASETQNPDWPAVAHRDKEVIGWFGSIEDALAQVNYLAGLTHEPTPCLATS